MKSGESPSLDEKGPVFNVTCVPWLNTKFSLEHSLFEIGDSDAQDHVN